MITSTLAQSIWQPESASTVAPTVDWLFYFILYLSTFFVVLIAGLMVYFAIRFRRKDPNDMPEGMTHSTALELTWTVIPTIILMFIFVVGFRGYLDMVQPPSGAYEITVNAQKWSWSFEYPNGAVSSELHVPANTPVILTLTSKDVIHSLYVPAFRTKKDAVPGRYNKTWFQSVVPDDRFEPSVTIGEGDNAQTFNDVAVYDIYCAEYCGTQHSKMLTHVVVHKPEDFVKWVKDAGNRLKGLSPVEMGRELFKQNGCVNCHSTDGTPGTCPTLKDVYGHAVQFSNGVPPIDKADENYIRESIVDPNARIVMGYSPGAMSSFANLPPEQIDALVAYVRSLSSAYTPEQGLPTDGEDVLQDQANPDAPGGMDVGQTPETPAQQAAEDALQGPENPQPKH